MASSGNFCVWNAVMGASNFTGTLSIGNTKSQPTSDCTGFGTMAMTTGKKWYFEARAGAMSGGSSMIGIMKLSDTYSISNYNTYQHSNTNLADAYYVASGDRILNGSGSTVGGAYSENDVIGVAVDLESSTNTITFYKNNSGQGSLNLTGTGIDYVPSLIRTPNAGGFIGNWGQDSTFGGAVTAGGNSDANGFGDFLYSVPSGHLAICSANLGISDDIDPAQTDDDFPQKQFNTITYTGNGSTNAISGLGFQPDLIWIKRRNSSATYSNGLVDSSRGRAKVLISNLTNSDYTSNSTQDVVSIDSDGFTLGTNSNISCNGSSDTHVAWCWKCNGGTTTSDSSGDITVTRQTNDAAKFSILTYTGNGSSGSTIAHGLGVKPAMTIIKQRNSSNGWNVWHQGNNNGDYDSFGELNSNASWYQNQGSNGPFSAAPGTDYLTLTAYGQVNGSGNTYVAYVWADVEGMQKFGSFEGNNSTDGPFVYTGFRPRLLVIKGVDEAYSWFVFDSARNTFNLVDKHLRWDGTDAEITEPTGARRVDFLSNGFKVRASGASLNGSSDTYVYMAWGDVPFKYNNTF